VRVLRWILLVPVSAGTFYLVIAATIAAHYLVEQHLCPAADFDRGICSNRELVIVLAFVQHAGAALTVLIVAGVSVLIAPSHERQVFWATLGALLLCAAWFGYAGHEGTLFVAALAGGVLAAAVISWAGRGRGPVA
jgi:hypothetical protein